MPDRLASSAAPDAPADDLMKRVGVLLPLPLRGAYDYRVPPGLSLCPGAFVTVPLGGRDVIGVVWDGGSGEVAEERLKPVAARINAPPLAESIRAFVDWVAGYTLSSPGSVLRMAMSVPDALEPPKPMTGFMLAVDPSARDGLRLTSARKRLLEILEDGPPRLAVELAREAGCGVGVVRGLADAGVLSTVPIQRQTPVPRPDPDRPGPRLSEDQARAADALRQTLRADAFSATLLDGVTGAGKTEVYFEAIAEALSRERQALVLLPEIALSSQWLGRFRERFGATPAEWHSDLTHAQRRDTWRAVAEGRVRVLVGARSALFLPFPRLGLIVVDEEHDPAYKQEDGVIYHARDMAIVRARLAEFPVVLASATPSLETVANVEAGRYALLQLPDRHGPARLPHVELIDMRRDGPARQSWLSPVLGKAITETLAAGEQVMLFLNRRGYAPVTLCRACGHRMQCPNCTAWLVEHRLAGRLQCHHCGHGQTPPDHCPACGVEESLVACGPGVERLAEEIAMGYPDARSAVVSSDTLSGPAAGEELVRQVQDHEIDLLIGTQLMAKGHHFPNLTLVGVIDADLGLSGGDLRAGERTYQILTQAAGRAGRADRPGRVFLQTYDPDHPVMQALASGDRERFLEAECEDRRARGLPPFGRLAAVIVSGPNAQAAENAARALGRTAPRTEGVDVLGPAPAPFAVLRGRYRYRLLLKAGKSVNVQRILSRWLNSVRWPASVRVRADVDPYSFL